jgi:Notch-like protein
MILAARLAIEGMVEELINAEADINAMDEYGKTALHWAAAVNNAEATLVLLQHGANRDAQDVKVFYISKNRSKIDLKIDHTVSALQ